MSQNIFEVVLADTSVARQIHYRLRYQVFCLDTGFEDPSRYPNQEEKDQFDERAVHFIVRNTLTGQWLAAARIILPSEDPLPIERYGKPAADENRHLGMSLRKCTAEVSRLLIADDMPQPYVGLDSPSLHSSQPQLPSSSSSCVRPDKPAIIRNLLRGGAAYCVERDIPQTAFFVTRALARSLTRMGIELTLIGSAFNHRGIRYPYVTSTDRVYRLLSGLAHRDKYEYDRYPAYRRFSELPLLASSEAA